MHTETMLHMEYGEHALATKKMHGPSTSNPHEWIVDSGCINHMTPYIIQLNKYERLQPPILVMTGSRQVIYAIGIGDTPVLTNNNTQSLYVRFFMYPNSCSHSCQWYKSFVNHANHGQAQHGPWPSL